MISTITSRFAALTSLFLVLSFCLVASAGAQSVKAKRKHYKTVTSPEYRSLDKVIVEGIKQSYYPGAVLIIGQGDKIKYAKAYGRYTYSNRSPRVTLNTIFDLASNSKVVGTTTATILNLADEKFSLDTSVYTLVPGFEKYGKDKVTVKDLMTHVSGLQSYVSANKYAEPYHKQGMSKADALIKAYCELKPQYELRKGYKYSCLNFQTLARLNENATEERLEDELIERVWEPMGMDDTRYILNEEQLKRTIPAAKGLKVGKVHDPLASYYGSVEHCPGNAGVYSTGPDLAKYCQMLLNHGKYKGEQILDSKILAQAMDWQTPKGVGEGRGLGFDIWEAKGYVTDINKQPGRYIVGHTGYTGTLLWLDTYTKNYVVFLTNRCYTKKGKKMKLVTKQRKAICTAVLKAQPEYKTFYAKKK